MSESRAKETSARNKYEFTQRVLVVAAVAIVAVTAAVAFAVAYDVFFLFFLAVLLAVLLRAASDGLARATGAGPGWSLGVVILVLIALAAGAVYGLGSMAVSQANQFTDNLPKSLDEARAYLHQHAWGREVIRHTPSAEQLIAGESGANAAWVSSFFSTTLGVLGNVLVLAFLALYFAASPQTYLGGLLRLVPSGRRSRAEEVLSAVGFHLRWWMIGRAVAMVAVALVTGAGLWLVGVPQFLILGVIAGLLTAVPYIGPILGAIPGVLLALMQGPDAALWAVAVYTLAQAAENYVITPLIQQRTVELPPALAIMALTLVGVVFGVLGLIVGSPLVVTIMVVVKMLYVEDILGDRLQVSGAEPLESTHVPHRPAVLGSSAV